MLRNCGCFEKRRRNSSVEDTSSCRSSELERGTEIAAHGSSLFKFFSAHGWCRRPWRKAGRGMSMTKVERSEFIVNNL